ncbi:M24 family metallopeptidase [Sediminibacillus albus]|uniref:Antitoxin VapB n=1 Tax=Sediminibacillus albus TaxID=407036 RepID=A0A1G8WIK8_9BACI|nr:M24 family metallopeptidase [Sediminibacillus albus]SDJ77957.1 antitoxin VapB [Sediminibacillus albus]
MAEINEKVVKLQSAIESSSFEGIVLTQQKNVSWLVNGRSFINTATEKSVAVILVTDTSLVLFVNNIEKERLVDEEFDMIFDQIEVYPWHTPGQLDQLIAKHSRGKHIAGEEAFENQLLHLRTVMTDKDIEELRDLAKQTAQAIEQAAFEIVQGDSEYQIAGRLMRSCLNREVEPVVSLAAVDERVFLRRHPLPTSRRLKDYAMLVVCGRRNGKVVSVSRLVHFGQPAEIIKQRHQAVITIDARLIEATVTGTSFREIFVKMQAAYAACGFKDEWELHHQGGLSGYNTREVLLLPDNQNSIVQLGQVYAWNPSIAGVKSEDTILVGENGPEVLSYTGDYPMEAVQTADRTLIYRPSILIR